MTGDWGMTPNSPTDDFRGDVGGLLSMAETVRTLHLTDLGARKGERGLSSARETVRRQTRRSMCEELSASVKVVSVL